MPSRAAFVVLQPVPLVLHRAVFKDTDMPEWLATDINIVVRHKNIKLTVKTMMTSLTEMKKILTMHKN